MDDRVTDAVEEAGGVTDAVDVCEAVCDTDGVVEAVTLEDDVRETVLVTEGEGAIAYTPIETWSMAS